MRSWIWLFLIFLSFGCGKNTQEEKAEAIDLALTYLSSEMCQDAIDVLEEAGRDTKDPVYLQVLASAYACRAGYNEITFFSSDIPKIQSSTANFMKSLTSLRLSAETEAASDEYEDLKTALNILLNLDTSAPSQVDRQSRFGPRKAGDMGTQALFLSLVQLGKFLHFYGNVDSSGSKGLGAANTHEQGATASTCFVEYTGAAALSVIGTGVGGICNNMASDDGHPNLSFLPASLTTTKSRMCEGLMLVTNIMDILENITLPSSSSFGQITSVKASIIAVRTAITGADPNLSTLMSTTKQSTCETLVEDATNFDRLQHIYAMLFEGGLQ